MESNPELEKAREEAYIAAKVARLESALNPGGGNGIDELRPAAGIPPDVLEQEYFYDLKSLAEQGAAIKQRRMEILGQAPLDLTKLPEAQQQILRDTVQYQNLPDQEVGLYDDLAHRMQELLRATGLNSREFVRAVTEAPDKQTAIETLLQDFYTTERFSAPRRPQSPDLKNEERARMRESMPYKLAEEILTRTV